MNNTSTSIPSLTHQEYIDLLKKYRETVWLEINEYLDSLKTFPDSYNIDKKYNPLVDFTHEIIKEYPQRRGKYIRPTLLLWTTEAMGGDKDKAIKTAAAMQVSEDWILNHDDIEDDSLERRGLPALHRMYSKELALNAGDGLHALMWKILTDNYHYLGGDLTCKISNEFYSILRLTVFGQMSEIKWMQDNKLDVTSEDVLFIAENKTGYYTFGGPMRLGAIIAGADDEQLEHIYNYGKIIVKAFQIKDDLLDLTSDFQGLKKQKGNDIYEGKRTIMLTHLLKATNKEDNTNLCRILSKNRSDKTQAEVDWVIDKMKSLGSLEYADNLVRQFALEAKVYFQKNLGFLKQKPARDYIEYLPEFLINRDH